MPTDEEKFEHNSTVLFFTILAAPELLPEWAAAASGVTATATGASGPYVVWQREIRQEILYKQVRQKSTQILEFNQGSDSLYNEKLLTTFGKTPTGKYQWGIIPQSRRTLEIDVPGNFDPNSR